MFKRCLKLLFLLPTMLSTLSAYACGGTNQQVYSGKIEYSLNPDNPLQCSVTITLDFDINEATKNDSIWVSWGDNVVSTIYASQVSEDSAASLWMGGTKIYTHVYNGTHIYQAIPSSGYYFITFQNEYRINGVTNIAGGGGINMPLNLVAQVSIDSNRAGYNNTLQFAPLQIGFTGLNSFRQAGFMQPADSNTYYGYSLSTPIEAISNPVPEYIAPGLFCTNNGFGPDSFSIDSITGDVEWSLPCLEGIYSFGTTLNKYCNGRLIGSIMREQNIYVLSNGPNAIINQNSDNAVRIFPNPSHNKLFVNVAQGGNAISSVSIKSIDGRTPFENLTFSSNNIEIDLSALCTGTYILCLHTSEGNIIRRFLKK